MSVEIVMHPGPLPTLAPLACGDAGAVLCFDGVIRADEDGRRIDGIEYEAYRPMAEDMLRVLAEEAVRRFGVLGVRVVHSEGFVPVGACAFRLQIASAHRAEGIGAMGWFIDRMKQDVPIWKRARVGARAQGAS